MTDRYNMLTVALEQDIRGDDAETLIQAIRMLRGALCVEGNVADPGDYLAQNRAKWEIRKKIIDLLAE